MPDDVIFLDDDVQTEDGDVIFQGANVPGGMTITLTAKAPAVSFTVKAPAITFSARAPGITFTVFEQERDL